MLNEVNQAISAPIGIMNTGDDEELMNELDELEAKEYESGMLEMDAPVVSRQQNRVVEPAQKAPVNDLDDLYNELQM